MISKYCPLAVLCVRIRMYVCMRSTYRFIIIRTYCFIAVLLVIISKYFIITSTD